ncbi:MAG: hypothetical protein KAJ60_11360 [Desulfobulbaceae bacterium]|nr:hypothetical protein [Desulfobulbaceae bacterium]
MMQTVCSLDLGTSIIKSALVDSHGRITASATAAAPALEGADMVFDADAYVAKTVQVMGELIQSVDARQISIEGISISSQRASLVLLGDDGAPLCPVYSWVGTSCAEAADNFFRRFGPDKYHQLTGLPSAPIYSLAKLVSLKERLPDVFAKAAHIGTLHDYVMLRLGANAWVTDHSNGSATGMYDITRKKWSSELLDAVGLPENTLPRLENAGSKAGILCHEVAKETAIAHGTPLYVGAGDQQCAVFGAGALEKGECLISLGTAAVAAVSFDDLPKRRPKGVLLLSHVLPDFWHAEGFMNAFGSALEWTAKILHCDGAAEVEALAAKAPDGAQEVVFLPHLAGIGTPDMSGTAKGSFSGLCLSTTREQMARAVFDGLANEVGRIATALSAVTPITSLTLVGGGRGKDLFPQLLADVTRLPVFKTSESEAALIGAAALAWAGSGYYSDPADAIRAFGSDLKGDSYGAMET